MNLMTIGAGSSGQNAAPTYAEILRDTYGASEVWALVDMSTWVIPALVSSDRNGESDAWVSGDTTGPVTGTNAPRLYESLSAGDIFTDTGTTGLKQIFNASKFSIFVFCRPVNFGDAGQEFLVSFYTDGNNNSGIQKLSNNTMRIKYKAGGTLKTIDIAGAVVGWHSFGMSVDTVADELKAFQDGSQSGATVGLLGAWAGDLTAAGIGEVVGASNLDGWIAYVAVRFGAVWTPVDFAAMHAAAATALPDTPTASPTITMLAPLPIQVEQASLRELGGLLYLAGGTKNAGDSATLWAYDPVTDTWDDTLSSMATAQQSMVMRVVNGKLYAIGGLSGGVTFRDTVYEYTPGTDTWAPKTVMPTAREDMGSAVISDKIHVFGGIKAGAVQTTEHEVYDPSTDGWDNTVDDLPGPKLLGDLGATYNGKAYAIGGSEDYTVYPNLDGGEETYEYNPGTDSWSTKATSNPEPKAYKDVVAIGQYLYVLGGSVTERDNGTKTVWRYDASSDTWLQLDDLPTEMSHAATEAYNGEIYSAGGQKNDGTKLARFFKFTP